MDQFEGQVLYVEVKTLEMAMALVKEGFKLGGGIAKAGLLLVLDKVKETKKNKAGLVSLKELLRGEDGVSSFTVKDTMRDSLEKQFTEMGIKYGCVENTDSKEVRFFIEDRRLSLVKSILEDMVKNEEIRLKRESTIKNFVKNVNDENIDIKDINDKEINYRHKVENIDKDTALILKDELTKNDIKSELIITGINKDSVKMAVIIQQYISGQVAAVIQSFDIVNELPIMLIEYASGSTSAIVDGTIDAEFISVSRDNRIVEKPETVPFGMDIVIELNNSIKILEDLLKSHVEVEIQIENNVIYYLQVRKLL